MNIDYGSIYHLVVSIDALFQISFQQKFLGCNFFILAWLC